MPVGKMAQFRPLPVVLNLAQFGGSTPTYGGAVVILQQCVYRPYAGCIPAVCRLWTVCTQPVDRPSTVDILSPCRLYSGRRPCAYRPHAGCIQAVYRRSEELNTHSILPGLDAEPVPAEGLVGSGRACSRFLVDLVEIAFCFRGILPGDSKNSVMDRQNFTGDLRK